MVNQFEQNEDVLAASSSKSKISFCCCYLCCYKVEKRPRSSSKLNGHSSGSRRETLNNLFQQLQLRKPTKRNLEKRRPASASIDRNINYKQKRNVEAINNLIESRRRVVRLSIVLVLLFLFSWLPYHIISLTIDVLVYTEQTNNETMTKMASTLVSNNYTISTKTTMTAQQQQQSTGQLNNNSHFIGLNIYPIALCLALANSVTNPVCYISLSHGFRKMFKASFKRFFNCNI